MSAQLPLPISQQGTDSKEGLTDKEAMRFQSAVWLYETEWQTSKVCERSLSSISAAQSKHRPTWSICSGGIGVASPHSHAGAPKPVGHDFAHGAVSACAGLLAMLQTHIADGALSSEPVTVTGAMRTSQPCRPVGDIVGAAAFGAVSGVMSTAVAENPSFTFATHDVGKIPFELSPSRAREDLHYTSYAEAISVPRCILHPLVYITQQMKCICILTF